MYPLLSDFAGSVSSLLTAGDKKVVIDLAAVNYIDSASIGCLMDLYRQASAAGGSPEALRRPEARRDHAHDDGRPELPGNPSRRGQRDQKLRG